MGVLDQAGKAALAARTALSSSSLPDMGTVDNSVPSSGEITGSARFDPEATKSPLI
jgi:hypothetical protein